MQEKASTYEIQGTFAPHQFNVYTDWWRTERDGSLLSSSSKHGPSFGQWGVDRLLRLWQWRLLDVLMLPASYNHVVPIGYSDDF